MWRLALGQLRSRPGRTFGLLFGVVVATASFAVLTGASQAGRLQVRGTVAENFRTSYDILVRPKGARSSVEREDGLVRPGALSGIGGGITFAEWQRVLRQPGVEVAAPIAIVGYALPDVELPIDLTDRLGRRTSTLLRADIVRVTDRGLTRQTDVPLFGYLTERELLPEPTGRNAIFAPRVETGGGLRPICNDGYRTRIPRGPFDAAARGGERGTLDCSSTQTGRFGDGFAPFPRGRVGVVVKTLVPFVIAAIDPAQEARLTDLEGAVSGGRYLRSSDRPSDTLVPKVPVLVADGPYVDQATAVTVRAMPARARREMEAARTPNDTKAALRSAPGPVVMRRTFTAAEIYRRLLGALDGRSRFPPAVTTYWAIGPTTYERGADDALRPRPVRNPPEVWSATAEAGGYIAAPLAARDPQFRRLIPSVGATTGDRGMVFAALRSVGQFDPAQLATTGDPRVDAALGTRVSGGLRTADARSRRLLGGRPLLPNGNIAGYATQAPLILTNLRSLPAFGDGNYRPNRGRAPISAIRVRVADVKGIDTASRERVRQTAQAIRGTTGLDVDLTIGSSASPRSILLPAGHHGRPELRLTEDWVRKGVALIILSAVDRKSVALFVLILAVCALFVANATSAAVAARRTELAVLACVGWSPARLIWAIVTEVAVIGLAAGLLGGLIALVVAGPLDLGGSPLRAALAVPAGVLLSMAAAAVPAFRVARTHPAAALRPAVAGTRRGHSASGIGGLATINVLRTPGRSGLAVASLAVGIMTVTLLLSITLAFRGAVVGSVLGDAVAVDVRSVDYIAAAVTIILGVIGVADVLYLNLRERAAELAVLRASGWRERDVAHMVIVEGTVLGAAAGVTGAVVGLAAAWTFTGQLATGPILAAIIGVLGGTLLTVVATLVPARLAGERTVASELSVE